MAVIRREKIYAAGEPFDLVVKYSARDQLFSIEFPLKVSENMHISSARGSSEKEARDYFDKICKKYTENETKTRKVIAYRTDINVRVFEGEGSDRRFVFEKNDIHFCDCDCALGIGYEVLQESTITDMVTYRSLRGDRRDLRDRWEVIGWTEEREAFFKNTVGALENLIVAVHSYFQSSETLVKNIEQKNPLMQIGHE
jgi:hypothetical protein